MTEVLKLWPDTITQLWLDNFYLKREKRKGNTITLVVGNTNQGKSYLSMYQMIRIDPTFYDAALEHIPSRISFDVLSFVDMNNNLGPGVAYLGDDFGVALSPEEWNTVSGRVFGKIIQSNRWKRHKVFFTTPDMDFLIRRQKKMINLLMQVDPYYRGKTKIKIPYTPQNVTSNKSITRYIYPLTDFYRNGKHIGKYKIKWIQFPDLSKLYPKLVHEYEKYKQESLQNDYLDMRKMLSNKLGIKLPTDESTTDEEEEEKKDMRGQNPNSQKNILEYHRRRQARLNDKRFRE